MTSKEALERYYSNLLYGNCGFQTEQEELDGLNAIKQDLERLEAIDNLTKTIETRVLHEFNLPYDYFEVKRENEKLKKAIEKELALLNERRETFWFTDSYDEYAVVNEIIEELKEVLGND